MQFDHSETEGELFDEMDMKLQAIASMTGMTGIFIQLIYNQLVIRFFKTSNKILSNYRNKCGQNICWISLQKDEFENLKKGLDRKTKEFEIIKQISSQIIKTLDVNLIASAKINAMDEFFGFKYSMILLIDEKMQKLNVLATHGYE